MKFGLAFANAGPFGRPDLFEVLVRGAEDAGFESIWTVEHVLVPVGYESRYPYSPTGRMPGAEDVPIPDPLLPLAYAAAISERLRLATGILILPQRHPAYVAKAMATLDQLSRGRAILGVGIGWLEEEFDAIGVPFRERAPRTEESVRAIRSLWAEKAQPFEGRFYRWGPVESHPKPVQKPGVPIVVGGHVEGAARRAARCADGFAPLPKSRQHLEALLAAMRDECAAIGRDPAEIEVTVMGANVDPDSLRTYAELGVSRVLVGPPGLDPEGLKAGLAALGENVVAKT